MLRVGFDPKKQPHFHKMCSLMVRKLLVNFMIHKSFFFCLCLWLTRGVFGVDGDEVKSLTEGDSVTLHTDITEIQRDDQIIWRFGPEETRIAEIYKKDIDMHDSNEIFGNRLNVDSQTGSLTITNITIKDTGLYKLEIFKNKVTSYKKFNIIVYAPLPAPLIVRNRDSSQCPSSSSSVSKCALLCSVLNVRDVSLSWYKGNSLLSSISESDLNIRLSLPLEVDYQDNNTYRCVLNNTITNQTQHLNVTHVCQTCSERKNSGWIGGVVVGVILLILVPVVVALAVICFGKIFRQQRNNFQTHEELVYAETTFCTRHFKQSLNAEEDHVVYSSVIKR